MLHSGPLHLFLFSTREQRNQIKTRSSEVYLLWSSTGIFWIINDLWIKSLNFFMLKLIPVSGCLEVKFNAPLIFQFIPQIKHFQVIKESNIISPYPIYHMQVYIERTKAFCLSSLNYAALVSSSCCKVHPSFTKKSCDFHPRATKLWICIAIWLRFHVWLGYVFGKNHIWFFFFFFFVNGGLQFRYLKGENCNFFVK